MPVDADHFEFALLTHEESIKEEAEKQFSQEGRIEPLMKEIYHPSGDVIGYEENPISPLDLPEIDISDMEADAAEITYAQMKRGRKVS